MQAFNEKYVLHIEALFADVINLYYIYICRRLLFSTNVDICLLFLNDDPLPDLEALEKLLGRGIEFLCIENVRKRRGDLSAKRIWYNFSFLCFFFILYFHFARPILLFVSFFLYFYDSIHKYINS